MSDTHTHEDPKTLIAQSTDHPMLDRMHKFQFVSGLSSNPSETRAVFVLSQIDRDENDYTQTLWALTDDAVTPLTALGKEGGYTWDGDDALIFAAKRTDKEKKRGDEGIPETVMYRLPLTGGEATPFATIPVNSGAWHPLADGTYLLSASVDPEDGAFWTLDDSARKELFGKKNDKNWRTELAHIPFWFNGRGYIGPERSQIFTYNPESKELTAVSENHLDLSIAYVSMDKETVYLTGSPWQPKRGFTSGLYRYDVKTQSLECLMEDTGLSIFTVFEIDEGLVLLGSDMKTLGLNQDATLWQWDPEANEVREVQAREHQFGNSVGTDVSYGGNRTFAKEDDGITATWTAHTKGQLVHLNKRLDVEPLVDITGSVTGFARVNGVRYVTALHNTRPAEIYRVETTGTVEPAGDDALVQVSHFNDALFAERPPLQPQPFTVPSPLGDGDIEGFVLTPPNFDADAADAYPAILNIHGGPKTVYGAVYSHEMQLWAYEGYVVMFCNPHGSDGRGNDFSDIRGRYGARDYDDLMAFVDGVVDAYPAIDASRLGVTGGSYGGFMTNWIVTHTDRFKAAATQRSISNWISFYGVADIGYYFATDQNKTELRAQDMFEVMWDHSPMKYIDQAKTPTLIIHSDADYRCPIEQGYQFLVGLQDREIPSKMVIFHGENHELSRGGKPKAREERLAQITDWMNSYLSPRATQDEACEA